MKYPEKKKCKFCGDMANLMDLKKMGYDYPGVNRYYYYHYSTNYDLGCHQRIGVETDRMKTLTIWTKDDEIANLKRLLKQERENVSKN